MEKVSKVEPDFLLSDVIVCVAAGIKANQFKAFMKVETNSIRVAGLSFQHDSTAFLADRNLLCLIH
jgi:hypothetical protein